MTERQAGRMETAKITKAYDEHRLLVGPGQTLRTSWGRYHVAAYSHSSRGLGPRSHGGGYASWTCSKCWKLAALEHNKEECHTCADWGGCGQDCTLSGIACTDCGTSMTA